MITRWLKAALSGNVKGHFGQWAEDVLVRKLFPKNKKTGTYLDIGAFHPFQHSNTAWFWMKGWHGINVDANPITIKLFNKIRPSDKNIWAAIIPQSESQKGITETTLMLPDNNKISGVGTCNPSVNLERNFKQQQKVPAKSINQIIIECDISELDYLNIDIEGYDEYIIKNLDFSIVKPKVITIEDYSENITDVISSVISTTLFSKGYNLIGRAGLTSIFVASNNQK